MQRRGGAHSADGKQLHRSVRHHSEWVWRTGCGRQGTKALRGDTVSKAALQTAGARQRVTSLNCSRAT